MNKTKHKLVSAKTGKKQASKDTKFKKGLSGNPKGRPQGSRNRATILAQNLVDDQAEALVQKLIEMALKGDLGALKLCVSRLIPPCREYPMTLKLSSIKSIDDLPKLLQATMSAVGRGKVTPSQGEYVLKMIDSYRRCHETMLLETRVQKLEESMAQRK